MISSSKISRTPETMAGSVEVVNYKDQVETQSQESDKTKASNRTGIGSKDYKIFRNMAALLENIVIILMNGCTEEMQESNLTLDLAARVQIK